MNVPTREYIIDTNRIIISESGGDFTEPDNLIFPEKLDWVLEAIRYPIFSTDIYPSILEKAAILSWKINQGHVFNNGNKRTSIFILLMFLHSNGFDLDISDEECKELALRVATSQETHFSFASFVDYLSSKLIILKR